MKTQNVPEQHTFWLKGGKAIKNLQELVSHLETMDENTFKHHVNEHKNDFATWVEHAIGNRKLALRLSSVSTPEHMAHHIQDHLVEIVDKKEKRILNEPELPTKIVTPNVTKLSLAHKHERIVTSNKTQLMLNHPPHRIQSMHKTQLFLSLKQKHLPLELASYLVFGVVVGVALAILMLL